MIKVQLDMSRSGGFPYFCYLCGKEIIRDGINPLVMINDHTYYAHTQCMEELIINYKQVVKDNEYERLLINPHKEWVDELNETIDCIIQGDDDFYIQQRMMMAEFPLCILDNKLYNTLVKFKRRKLYTWLRTHCADVKRYLDKKKD